MISKNKAAMIGVALVLITAILTFMITNTFEVVMGERVVVSKADYENMKDVEKLLGLKEYIKNNYVEGADDDKLMDGAMKGVFEALEDPYSIYMTASEFKSMNESTSGNFGGIGVIVTKSEEGYITVVAPVEDTPGEKAGIKTNDKIIKVDDKDLIGMELDKAVELIKGKPGTKVTLTISRDKVPQPMTFAITREMINQKAVKSELKENEIGYIRLSSFDSDAGKDFKRELTSLKNKKMKGLILDLRQNPGGYVSSCLEIADELLGEGMVVYTEDIDKNRQVYNSKSGGLEVPLIILVDGGSASASEILSGAVKDRKAGLLIGEKTFGKGLVQSVESLKDGSGFKLTTQKYYTPNGISINKIGIEPNIEVKPMEVKEDQRQEDIKDLQLEKAIEEMMKQIK
ncbi:MAG: family peptidase [Clostridia bacterium]|jgi:carboxyl-terminal processing protease|nr:family peptidase [Clostridia bacterium]